MYPQRINKMVTPIMLWQIEVIHPFQISPFGLRKPLFRIKFVDVMDERVLFARFAEQVGARMIWLAEDA